MIVQCIEQTPKITAQQQQKNTAELLSAVRSGLVALALCRPSRSATASDLEYIVHGLNASTGWRISLAEGTAFPHADWMRCEGGWRLREGSSRIGAAA